ncbi:MAG: hypothetical protein QOH03_1427 [Kribbellaceae bacterium]|jgi:hypothetical protein|nr:hypothetical protein [Kribbellaceae bacterium]
MIKALQHGAGDMAVQGKLGPWLREHAKPGIDALAASPPDFGAAMNSLNGFSTDDIATVLRNAGGPKRTAMGTYIDAGKAPAVDVPRFVWPCGWPVAHLLRPVARSTCTRGEAAGPQARPDLPPDLVADARPGVDHPDGPWSYGAHAAESEAMRGYFALRVDPAALKAKLDGRDDAALKGIFGDPPPAPGDRAAVLRGRIDADHDQLTAPPEVNPALPLDKFGNPGTMDSPFDPKKGHPDPSQGFLSIRKEIIEALKESDPAMQLGGTDFGGETGDLMHFELHPGMSVKDGVYFRKKK